MISVYTYFSHCSYWRPQILFQREHNIFCKCHVPFCTRPADDQKGRRLAADSCHKADISTTSHLCRSALNFCPECHHPKQNQNKSCQSSRQTRIGSRHPKEAFINQMCYSPKTTKHTSQSNTEACHWAILSMFSSLLLRSLICWVTFLMTASAAAT